MISSSELLSELKGILPAEHVRVGELKHPLGNGGIVEAFPHSEAEISAVLKYANETGKRINIEGAGSKRGFGGLNEYADILLSLSEYNGIVEHVVGDMTLTVKAGTNFMGLQDYLAKHNQKIPLDPFHPQAATIGGTVAANDSGPKRLGYGSARDAVIGLRVVYPDGKIIRTGGRVVKNVAGYDMNKLFIGSMGTLGVLSEVTLKLRQLPKAESLIVIAFPQGTFDQIQPFAVNLQDSMLEPVVLELLTPTLAEKVTGKSCFTLAIGLEGVKTAVRYQESFIERIQPQGTDLRIFSQQETQDFWERFYSMGHTPQLSMETASLKVGVVNMDAVQVIKECYYLGEKNGVYVEAHGGLGHGLCQVHLMGYSDRVVSIVDQIRDFVTKLGGYAVVKSMSLALRRDVSVWGEKPAHFFLLEAIKSKVDPKQILNPKRFTGGI